MKIGWKTWIKSISVNLNLYWPSWSFFVALKPMVNAMHANLMKNQVWHKIFKRFFEIRKIAAVFNLSKFLLQAKLETINIFQLLQYIQVSQIGRKLSGFVSDFEVRWLCSSLCSLSQLDFFSYNSKLKKIRDQQLKNFRTFSALSNPRSRRKQVRRSNPFLSWPLLLSRTSLPWSTLPHFCDAYLSR